MDWPLVLSIASLILGAGVIAGAAVVGIVVARRRGLDQVDERTDSAVQRTMDAQDRRLELQDREIADLKAQVANLTQTVAALRAELDIEKRITARVRAEVAGDGR